MDLCPLRAILIIRKKNLAKATRNKVLMVFKNIESLKQLELQKRVGAVTSDLACPE